MTYDNSNSGMLARNDKKETEKHPDFKGSINVARWRVGSSSPYPLARRNNLRLRLLHRKLRLSTS
jgi:hypothetical protein